ncbi:MFS transporter [Lactobacillus sp. PV034]|uniref:MFS transporter n=1 Tax=Lactobacillus sp. PV034 TaxID=2594495 RepID=UPI00223EFC78|nr:MFS transporter [Lactobacillus sp. PV034]QNQ81454.1 MFS transporter [Lactobacillus sp. PV034]
MNNFTKYGNVYRLLGGRIATNIADSLFYMSILWHFKEITNSTLVVSIIFAITSGIDTISFGFGPLIDRISIKRLLKISTCIQILISIGIVVMLTINIRNIIVSILILILFTISSILSSVVYPAEDKLLPLFVSEREVLRFNGIFQLTYKVLDIALDAFVTVIITITSINITVIFSGIVFAIALYFYSNLKIKVIAKKVLEEEEYFTGSYIKDLLIGWKTLKEQKTILELILPICVINLFYGIFMVGLPYFAQSYVKNSALGYGALLFASSLGSILGALLVQKFKIGKEEMHVFVALCFLGAGIFRLIVPLAITLNVWIILFASAISSAWITMMNINFESLVQLSFSSSVLGRVQTINYSILSVMIPIGSILGGWIVRLWGSLCTQYIYGISLLLCALYYILVIKRKPDMSAEE